ncbi:MAG: hypothetical protein AAFX87_17370 [Bacteroidota bacterium]
MKKLFLIALVCTTCLTVHAQPGEIISSENISAQKLKEIFENAYMDVSKVDPNGKFIAVKESTSLNVYIDIDSKKRYVTYSLTTKCDESFSECEVLSLINKLNSEVLMISPSYNPTKNTFLLKYDYWIVGGVTSRSIVKTKNQFFAAVKLAFQKDTQKIMK